MWSWRSKACRSPSRRSGVSVLESLVRWVWLTCESDVTQVLLPVERAKRDAVDQGAQHRPSTCFVDAEHARHTL